MAIMIGQRFRVGRLQKVLILAVVAGTVAGFMYALTANNTIPATRGGTGEGTITGFDVATVHYGLNVADPTKIESVSLVLDAAPSAGSQIKVKLVATGSDWYSCSAVGVNVTCATTSPQAMVATANTLTLVVAQ